MIDLKREGSVFVLTMQSVENRFNRGFLDAMTEAFDEIEASPEPAALVTTGGTEKFYSNGLDLDWLLGPGQSEGTEFVGRFLAFLGRTLAFPVPTVAAINGHAFAGGGMFALAHDFRVMRVDRGFFCLPEIDIKLPLAPGMLALIQAKVDASNSRDLILRGLRIGGEEAVQRRVADETVTADQVVARAIALAEPLASKDRATYGALKRAMYGEAIALLEKGELPAG
jgi:enoyl-CoA hydratase/carnithine racemase